jgi:hypothetical protein
VFGYLDLVGAGLTKDHARVRLADNLGVLVIGWALSDLRVYNSSEYMLSGDLQKDLVNFVRMVRYHTKVIWVIGGHGPTYNLHPSFTEVQQQVCALLRAEHQVVWTGAALVYELREYPHIREDLRLDPWHFVSTDVTEGILYRHM